MKPNVFLGYYEKGNAVSLALLGMNITFLKA